MSIHTTITRKNISNDDFGDQVQRVITENGIDDVGEVRFSDSGFFSVLGTSALTNDRTIVLPDASGTVALTSDIPSLTNYVTTNTSQSISGQKTFSVAPIISTILNTGTLTLPTTTGTLALTSQIPTNSTYVDLTTAQSVAGVKTFSNAPVFSAGITGPVTLTGDLTMSTGDLTFSTASSGVTDCNIRMLSANTGFRSDAANTVRLTVNGSDKLIVSTGSFQFTQTCRFVSGTVSSPGINWNSDTGNNSGWYLIANDTVGGSINGVQTHQWDANGYYSTAYRPLSGTTVTVVPTTNLSTGTCSLLVSPTSTGWSTGGIAQVSLGDSNHYIKATNGTGIEINSFNAIKLGSSGTAFRNMRYGSTSTSIPISAGSSTTISVSFGATFGSTPSVSVSLTAQAGSSNWILCQVVASSVTTTAFDATILNHAGSSTSGDCLVNWIAFNV